MLTPIANLLASENRSRWIPGASWAKFAVIVCFYRLFLGSQPMR
jgi:hypothetical protein